MVIGLPEIVWLGLLNEYDDLKKGASLSLALSKAANNSYSGEKKRLFAAISSYSLLNKDQCNEILDILEKSQQLEELQKALYPLFLFYPECPLNFLFQRKVYKTKSRISVLKKLKNVLASLFDREGKQATLMQANLIYIALCTDMLRVPKGSAISRFPNIIDYPNTIDSKIIASSIRASINGFFGANMDGFGPIPDSTWPAYFWNRGLVIEPCPHE